MKKTDGRKLREYKLAELRNKVRKVYSSTGGNAAKTAQELGVSRYFIIKWMKRYREQWDQAQKEGSPTKYIYLHSKKRGRRGKNLHDPISERIFSHARKIIEENAPNQVGMNSSLWTERTVKKLFKLKFNINLSHKCVYDFIRDLIFYNYRKAKNTIVMAHHDYGYVIINGYIYFLRKPKYTSKHEWEMEVKELVLKQRKQRF